MSSSVNKYDDFWYNILLVAERLRKSDLYPNTPSVVLVVTAVLKSYSEALDCLYYKYKHKNYDKLELPIGFLLQFVIELSLKLVLVIQGCDNIDKIHGLNAAYEKIKGLIKNDLSKWKNLFDKLDNLSKSNTLYRYVLESYNVDELTQIPDKFINIDAVYDEVSHIVNLVMRYKDENESMIFGDS